jgi:L-ascorbate metabolism protein UlaG (beta-lactamase superfamily)
MLHGIHWLGHASFRIDDDVVIYIDPWKLRDPVPADIVLVTHSHFDHMSATDIAKVATDDTVIVCAECAQDSVPGEVRVLAAGERTQVGDVTIEAVPAYNTDKPNHPRSAGFVGYVLQLGDRRIYHAGDTDLIPEMAEIRCDVALLPVGGTYTMDADQAAQAARRIEPKVVVPMHWGDVVGSEKDVRRLEGLLPETIRLAVLPSER